MEFKETFNIFSKVLNGLLIIMAIISFFLIDIIQKPIVWLFGFIVILIFLLLGIHFYLKRKTKKIIKTGNVKIIIEQGDIFDEEGLKVIPVDEELTLQVDNIKVSEKSLHGKFLKQYNIGRENLTLINDLYIYNEEYILFPFIKITDNKARIANKKEYIDKIYNLLDNLDSFENGRTIILPVIGDGPTRVNFIKENKKYELINLIIDIIKTYNFEKNVKIMIKVFDEKIKYFNIK